MYVMQKKVDRLCSLVDRVPDYRSSAIRGLPSFVTVEEQLGKKSIGSGLEIREYDRRDPSR
jgi:hypothetical protein